MRRTERFRKERERAAEVSSGQSSWLADEGPNDGQRQQGGTLMRTRRQKILLEPALEPAAEGEARSIGSQGAEARVTCAVPERPA